MSADEEFSQWIVLVSELLEEEPDLALQIRTIGNQSVCADYYLHVYPHAQHHCAAAVAAQRAYRAADSQLQELGFHDMAERQAIIHAAEMLT